MSRLLVVGFILTVVVLGFNYYTAIAKNAETSRELTQIRHELHEGVARRSEALKKWESCRSELDAAHDVSKKLDDEMKKKDQMIEDITKQITESRKRENKLKEELESLNARLSAADRDAKAEREKLLQMERRKCDIKVKQIKVERTRKSAVAQL